jgi:hypothetical protein
MDPSEEVVLTHKTLMVLLGQYEHLTKRISAMPVDENGTGGQATVQGAVGRCAAAFLTKEMLKVQVRDLPFFRHGKDLSEELKLISRRYHATKNAWRKAREVRWRSLK